jgi:hypothetical protein
MPSDKNTNKKEEPIGLDLVDNKPDYTKSKEEIKKEYRERYKKVHGEEPPGVDG